MVTLGLAARINSRVIAWRNRQKRFRPMAALKLLPSSIPVRQLIGLSSMSLLPNLKRAIPSWLLSSIGLLVMLQKLYSLLGVVVERAIFSAQGAFAIEQRVQVQLAVGKSFRCAGGDAYHLGQTGQLFAGTGYGFGTQDQGLGIGIFVVYHKLNPHLFAVAFRKEAGDIISF